MSRYNVECSTCGIHIGYVYHSGPIGWTNCVQCGDAEQEREEQEDDGEKHPKWVDLSLGKHKLFEDTEEAIQWIEEQN